MHRRRLILLAACIAVATGTLVATLAGTAAGSTKKTVISIAFGSTYVMNTPQSAPTFFGGIAKAYEASHPGVTVNLVPIPGSFTDIITKLSLLYRSPSTAPTIAELPTQDLGEFESAGYLLSLTKYLAGASWWSGYPAAVKSEGTVNGQVYAVNQGENVQALSYNIPDFKKAGIPVPWRPRTWQDVINALQKIKHALPTVTPIWAEGGSGDGSEGIILGVGNLLPGSTNPTVFDKSTGKWVVSSSGLTQVFKFIHTLTVDKLNAPVSQLFNANATGNAPTYVKSPGAAVAIASNYFGQEWLHYCAPCWPQAAKIVGLAPIPTVNGQGSDISSLVSGWDLAIYNKTPDPAAAFAVLNLMQSKSNMIAVDNAGGWIPPDVAYAKDPLYVNFSAPFQAEFANLEPHASVWPSTPDFSVWSQGFQNATGALEDNSGESVSVAVQAMKSYVTTQLGASKVESLP